MSSFTKRPLNDKEHKNLRIYNILMDREEVSRADLTSITKMNAVSVSNYTNAFMRKKLIIEKEIGISSGGRPPIILALNTRAIYAIGIHIAKNTVNGVLVDLASKKIDQQNQKTDADKMDATIKKMVTTLKKDIDTDSIKGISLSVEGADIDVEALELEIENEFQISTYSCRPSMAAAFVEASLRDRYSETRFLYSYKDIGDCIFLENFEFFTSEEDLDKCAYLRPWKAESSIADNAKRIIKQGEGTEILSIASGVQDSIVDIDVYKAAQKKDPLAIEILEFAGLNLGVRLAYLINVFNPAMLVLGGGVEQSGKYFIEPVKRSVEKLALKEYSKNVEITYSALNDKDTVATGAAGLVIREFFMGV